MTTDKWHDGLSKLCLKSNTIMNNEINRENGSALASSADFGICFDGNCNCLFCKSNFTKKKEFHSNVTNKKFKLEVFYSIYLKK